MDLRFYLSFILTILTPLAARASLSPDERFMRTQTVLDHLKIPRELPDYASDAELQGFQGIASAGDVAALARYFGAGPLKRIASWNDETFTIYEDADSKTRPEATFRLKPAVAASELPAVEGFHARLLAAAQAKPSAQPLAGLRIAIDPGHMGGPPWDERTGKFIHDKKTGATLSEGIMNLQTALLVEAELTRLGATVGLTHRVLGAVTDQPWDSFDWRPFAALKLERSILDGWWGTLVGKTGADLLAAADHSAKVHQILSDHYRDDYFILMLDLEARARFIRDFRADLALDIHFDEAPSAADHGVASRHRDGTKTYVMGGFADGEVASRFDKRMLAEHLLNPVRWRATMGLARCIVGHIHDRLGIPFDTGGGSDNAIDVAPGVYARNLGVPRSVNHAVMTYLESLFYNDPQEFALLTREDHVMQIGGQSYPYSDRLVQLAQAIAEGIAAFVHDYPAIAVEGLPVPIETTGTVLN